MLLHTHSRSHVYMLKGTLKVFCEMELCLLSVSLDVLFRDQSKGLRQCWAFSEARNIFCSH